MPSGLRAACWLRVANMVVGRESLIAAGLGLARLKLWSALRLQNQAQQVADGGGEACETARCCGVMVSSFLQGSDTSAECPIWHRA